MVSSNIYFADQVADNLNEIVEEKYRFNAENSEESYQDNKEEKQNT